MKSLITKLLTILLLIVIGLSQTIAQEANDNDERVLVKVTTNDGTEFIGYILQEDKREILIETKEKGEFYIPQYSVKKIEKVYKNEFLDGKYVGEERFSTRYFISTNGLPIKKGDHYAMLNIYGPEIHFAIADNFSVGLMTTWVAMPMVATAKYSVPLGKNLSASVGVLAGSTLWLRGLTGSGGYGALGFGSLTFGDRTANFTVSGGYAGVTDGDGSGGSAPLFSIAGMVKIDRRVTLVGDSFIYAGDTGEGNSPVALIMPGLRFDLKNGGAFQLGTGMVAANGQVIPVPIPTFGWFLAFN